jgi:hypothetical protein
MFTLLTNDGHNMNKRMSEISFHLKKWDGQGSCVNCAVPKIMLVPVPF